MAIHFSEPALEPSEPEVVGHCAACGEPIYAGEAFFADETDMLHNDETCLWEWMRANMTAQFVGEAVGMERRIAGDMTG